MKKIPLRKCVATQEQLPKKELIRVVRSKEGELSVDPTGKKNGRGAYLKRSHDAIELAKKNGINMTEQELCAEANKWELSHGGISGRTAQQFINYCMGMQQ